MVNSASGIPTARTDEVSSYEQMVALYAERSGPLLSARDDYTSWSQVPIAVQSAVIAWDAARRGGSTESPMSERNALSMAGMMRQALVATTRGFDDLVDEELRRLRLKVKAAL